MSLERPNTLDAVLALFHIMPSERAISTISRSEMQAIENYEKNFGKPAGPTIPSARALAYENRTSYRNWLILGLKGIVQSKLSRIRNYFFSAQS
jgi:hypothetical protein